MNDLDLVEQYYRNESQKSFYKFRQIISVTQSQKFKKGWFSREISHELQAFYDDLVAGNKPILLIQTPPQHGKSRAVVEFVAWLSGKHPEFRTVYASFSDTLGIRANRDLRRIIDSNIYKVIFPDFKIGDTRNERFLNNSDGGSFRNTTVQGRITGESLDLGVIDDPIKGRAEAGSITIREKSWNWLTDDFYSRFSEDAGMLMIATAWHVDDPVSRMIDQFPEAKLLRYKAIAEENEKFRKKGEALFPEHKSIEFLQKRKERYAKESWQSLYQQNPIMPGGNKLDVKNFIEVDADIVERITFDKYFITSDTALKDKEKNDYTVCMAFGQKGNDLYILDVFRGKPLATERERVSRAFYAKNSAYPFVGYYIEQKASGIDLFQRMKGQLMVKEIERNVDKLFRAENVNGYIEAFKVYYPDNLPFKDDMVLEIMTFPDGTHDDIVDCIIDGVELAHMKKPFNYDDML